MDDAGAYSRLGVRTVLNAAGNLTSVGGSLMPSEVLAAMADAATSFVFVDELLDAAGRRVASLAGVEAAFVTSGAAAGLALAVAGCMTGGDDGAVMQLPATKGMRNEVLVQAPQRNEWLQAVRLTGARLREFGRRDRVAADHLDAALSSRSAAVLHFASYAEERSLALEAVIRVAHARGVPVIVDAAAELPPIENLARYCALGADLVIFSGGKMLRGPQCTGLIVGRASLVAACARNASPNSSIGRPFKVGKEEILGLVRAVELFMTRDLARDEARWARIVDYWCQQFRSLRAVRIHRMSLGEDDVLPRHVPRVYLTWSPHELGFDPAELIRALREGDPPVAVSPIPDGVSLNPAALEPDQERLVANQVRATLRALEKNRACHRRGSP